METWREVPGWSGFYEVSDVGRVRSVTRLVAGRWGPTLYRGRVLRARYTAEQPYPVVVFTASDRDREGWYVHDLVLLTFVGPKPAGLEVCHGPLGKQCNALSNLRYDTRSANALDRWRGFDRKAA